MDIGRRLVPVERLERLIPPTRVSPLARLTKAGAHAAAYKYDITDASQVKSAIAKCQEDFPPIRGAIQGAMALSVSSQLSVIIQTIY